MDTMIAASTLRLVSLFDAPQDLIFDAWTEAGHFVQWLCPPGFGFDQCEIDVRPGGVWRVKGRKPNGEAFARSGAYLEVKRPEVVAFTWGHHQIAEWSSPRGFDTTVRVVLRAVGKKTEVTLTQGPFVDFSSFNAHADGWNGSFGRFSAFLRRTA